jgi:hypothetical protein
MIVKTSPNFAQMGDSLGLMPCLAALAAREPLTVRIRRDPWGNSWQRNILDLASFPVKMAEEDDSPLPATERSIFFDLQPIETAANRDGHYMSQAYMKVAGLPVPKVAPRPILRGFETPCPNENRQYIGIAPFSRFCSPPRDMWTRENWQALVNAHPDQKFFLFGGPVDDPNFITGPNVTPYFGRPLPQIASFLRQLRLLVCVSTGISHLSFAVGTPQLLFYNQFSFQHVPDAFLLSPSATSQHTTNILRSILDGKIMLAS